MKQIFKKNLYRKDQTALLRNVFLIVVIAFYAVAFTSNIWLHKEENSIITPIGTEQPFNNIPNRAYIIYSAEYSPKQELLEIIMEYKNYNYDGKNEYHYGLSVKGKGRNTGAEEFAEIMNDSLVTVLQIKNLKSFEAVNILVAPDIMPADEIPEDMISTITLTKDNVVAVDELKERSKAEYLIYRFDYIIEGLRSELDKQLEKIEIIDQNIANLEKENNELKGNLEYVSDSEAQEMRKAVNINEDKILREKENRLQILEEISRIDFEIESNEAKRDELKL